jgi:hypothetical protein
MHIRMTETGDACTDQRAPTGTEGWVKAMQVNEMHMITPEGDRRVLHKMGPPPPLIDSGIGPIPPPPNASEPAP